MSGCIVTVAMLVAKETIIGMPGSNNGMSLPCFVQVMMNILGSYLDHYKDSIKEHMTEPSPMWNRSPCLKESVMYYVGIEANSENHAKPPLLCSCHWSHWLDIMIHMYGYYIQLINKAIKNATDSGIQMSPEVQPLWKGPLFLYIYSVNCQTGFNKQSWGKFITLAQKNVPDRIEICDGSAYHEIPYSFAECVKCYLTTERHGRIFPHWSMEQIPSIQLLRERRQLATKSSGNDIVVDQEFNEPTLSPFECHKKVSQVPENTPADEAVVLELASGEKSTDGNECDLECHKKFGKVPENAPAEEVVGHTTDVVELALGEKSKDANECDFEQEMNEPTVTPLESNDKVGNAPENARADDALVHSTEFVELESGDKSMDATEFVQLGSGDKSTDATNECDSEKSRRCMMDDQGRKRDVLKRSINDIVVGQEFNEPTTLSPLEPENAPADEALVHPKEFVELGSGDKSTGATNECDSEKSGKSIMDDQGRKRDMLIFTSKVDTPVRIDLKQSGHARSVCQNPQTSFVFGRVGVPKWGSSSTALCHQSLRKQTGGWERRDLMLKAQSSVPEVSTELGSDKPSTSIGPIPACSIRKITKDSWDSATHVEKYMSESVVLPFLTDVNDIVCGMPDDEFMRKWMEVKSDASSRIVAKLKQERHIKEEQAKARRNARGYSSDEDSEESSYDDGPGSHPSYIIPGLTQFVEALPYSILLDLGIVNSNQYRIFHCPCSKALKRWRENMSLELLIVPCTYSGTSAQALLQHTKNMKDDFHMAAHSYFESIFDSYKKMTKLTSTAVSKEKIEPTSWKSEVSIRSTVGVTGTKILELGPMSSLMRSHTNEDDSIAASHDVNKDWFQDFVAPFIPSLSKDFDSTYIMVLDMSTYDNLSRQYCDSVEKAIVGLQKILGRTYKLCPYGSSQLCLSIGDTSDIDLSCEYHRWPQYENAVPNIFAISKILRRHQNELKDVIGIRARVPVVKGVYISADNPFSEDGSIKFDICPSNREGVINTDLMKEYLAFDGMIQKLMLAVKCWARKHKLIGADKHMPNSFSWQILVVFYLQNIDFVPNLQNENFMKLHNYRRRDVDGMWVGFVGRNAVNRRKFWSKPDYVTGLHVSTLLAGFFHFYSDVFHPQSYIVSIRSGKDFKQKKVNWWSNGSGMVIEQPFEMLNANTSKNPRDFCFKVEGFDYDKIMTCFKETAATLKSILQGDCEMTDILGADKVVSANEKASRKLALKSMVSPRGDGSAQMMEGDAFVSVRGDLDAYRASGNMKLEGKSVITSSCLAVSNRDKPVQGTGGRSYVEDDGINCPSSVVPSSSVMAEQVSTSEPVDRGLVGQKDMGSDMGSTCPLKQRDTAENGPFACMKTSIMKLNSSLDHVTNMEQQTKQMDNVPGVSFQNQPETVAPGLPGESEKLDVCEGNVADVVDLCGMDYEVCQTVCLKRKQTVEITLDSNVSSPSTAEQLQHPRKKRKLELYKMLPRVNHTFMEISTRIMQECNRLCNGSTSRKGGTKHVIEVDASMSQNMSTLQWLLTYDEIIAVIKNVNPMAEEITDMLHQSLLVIQSETNDTRINGLNSSNLKINKEVRELMQILSSQDTMAPGNEAISAGFHICFNDLSTDLRRLYKARIPSILVDLFPHGDCDFFNIVSELTLYYSTFLYFGSDDGISNLY